MWKSLLSASLGLLLAPSLQADWPEFRGPAGNGQVEGSIPIEWSATENALWRTELPGEGWSSPIVVGPTIYLTAAIPIGDLWIIARPFHFEKK